MERAKNRMGQTQRDRKAEKRTKRKSGEYNRRKRNRRRRYRLDWGEGLSKSTSLFEEKKNVDEVDKELSSQLLMYFTICYNPIHRNHSK